MMAALLALSPSCSVLPERPPSPALHDFGSAERIGGSGKAAWSVVSVEAPEWLQGEGIRYRLLYADPTRVRFYAQDRWLAPPPALLAQRLSLAGGERGLRLKIRLLDFEQVFDEPTKARVVLGFWAVASLADGGGIVGEKRFQLGLPTASADAQGAVEAFAASIEAVANALEAWLAELPVKP